MPSKFDNSHIFGIALVVLSAIVFSSAGVFTKSVEAGAWEVIFWRGLFAALFTILYVTWRKTLHSEIYNMGWSGFCVAAIGASATAAFLTAFKLTSMANVMLIYAAAPLFSAAMAWIWIREKISSPILLGCFGSIIGVWIIIHGSNVTGTILGDLFALWMTIGMSILMVIYRRWPNTPAAGPAALSSVILLPFGIHFGNVTNISFNDFIVLACFGLIFAIASVTLAEGVKRISAGEAALLSTLETPLAPILGYLFFSEIPSLATFIGGSLILVSVTGSQVFSRKI